MQRSMRAVAIVIGFCLLLALPGAARADCPGNLLVNPSFENGKYKGETVGTSLSSWLSVDWLPWAVLGDQQINREIEFFVVDSQILQEGTYRVHAGRYAQKFFSGYSTHHAGFYQRVPVTPGQQVTFSIWVQIATGQQELWSLGLPVSDLSAPGNYRVWAGIDPYGGTPAGFGALPPASTVWSPEVIDRQTRTVDAQGHEIDGWVQLSVSTTAQSDYVTVYSRGQPEFPVKNNSSFWDDACVMAFAPPTPTAAPTNTPTETPLASPTPSVTVTPMPTNTPEASPTVKATATPYASSTPRPTASPLPSATATAAPTESLAPSATPVQPTAVMSSTETPTPSSEAESSGGTSPWVPVVGVVGALAIIYAVWRLSRRR